MEKIIFRFLLFAIIIGSVQSAAAQAPTISAPTPTHATTDVVSLFSEHYTTVGKGPEIQSWGGNAVTKVKIADTDDEVLSSSGGSSVIFTSGWTAQTKGYVHLDVYSVSGGTFSFGLGVSFSNNLTWLDDYTWPVLPAKQWTSINVPIVEFVKAGLDDAVNVQTIRFSGNGSYYVDNIYAYGDKAEYVETVNIAVAPTPTRNPSNVKSVFSDSYTNSQKGLKPQTFGGIVAKIMPYQSNHNEQVLKLEGLGTSLCTIDTWKIADQTYIHVDVYYAGGGDGSFSFGMNASDWSGNNIKTLNDYSWPNVIEGQWVSFDIPVSAFLAAGLNLNNITQIKFFGSGDFYIDNLYAYALPIGSIEAPTSVPIITSDEANIISIFCEQFEEAGYQDSELGITDLDANGNLMFYGQNATQNREFVEIVPGNKTIKLTNWNDYPFKPHKNSTTIDLSTMDYLHISAYLVSNLDVDNKPATLTFFMHDNNGKKLDNAAQTVSVAMMPGEWVSISIPLCHYMDKIDLSNVYVLRPRLGGYSAMDVYFDNIFAYKGNPLPRTTVGAPCDTYEPPCTPIQDTSNGELPPHDWAMLGVNLASAAGGSVPGVLGTNYRYPKLEDLYYFNAKKVKLFRIPFRWKRVQSELGGPLVTQDINAIKEVVREAERLGIWVMLDMHDFGEYTMTDTIFTIDGRYRTKNANDYWGPWKNGDGVSSRDLRNDFADVWVKIANEFKDFRNIWGYDLMNEPKDVDIVRLKESYQLVIDEIRKIDTKTAIVLEGKNYASSSDWANISDELKHLIDPIGNNIIYQAHTYFDNDKSGTYNEDYDTEIKGNFNVYKDRLNPFINWCKTNDKKGMIGEFGVPYNGAEYSDPRYMVLIDSVFNYLKEHQITATYWCAGAFYESNHLTVQPAKDYCTEKSTMGIMDKYIEGYHVTTGVHNPSAVDEVFLYPNPVTDKLHIKANIKAKSIHLSNLMGQKIYTIEDNPSDFIDMSSLPSGKYILQIVSENNGVFVEKIIKM